MHIELFVMTSLFSLTLAIRAKMQWQEVIWDKHMLLSEVQK